MNVIEKIFWYLLPLPFTTLGLSVLTFQNNYIPEFFIIAYMFLYALFVRKLNLINDFFLNKRLNLIVFLSFGISLLSLLHLDFEFVNYYGRFRALYFFIIGFFIVYFSFHRGILKEAENFILIICASGSIMYLINALLVTQSDESKVGISMICYATVVCLSLERKKFLNASIFLIFSMLSAYLSFFRQNYIIAMLLIIFSMIYIIYSSISIEPGKLLIKKSIVLSIVLLVFIGFLVVGNLGLFYDFLSSSESRYIQSIGKFNDLLDLITKGALDESSSLRLQSYMYILNNMQYFIFPNGFVNDSSLVTQSIWGGEKSSLNMSITRDSVLAYALINFGFILSFYLFFKFMLGIIYAFKINSRRVIFRIIFISPAIFSVLLLDGATLTQLQKSFFFGIGLALLLYNSEMKSKKQVVYEK